MNVFEYAYSSEQSFFKKPLADCGYESFTTFYSDASIGEFCEGIKGVKDTIQRATSSWLNDYKYITELIMVCSWKQFEMDYRINHNLRTPHNTPKEYLEFYAKEYQRLDALFLEHYEGNEEALSYYYKTTD